MVKALVADDSYLMKKFTSNRLESDPDIAAIAKAKMPVAELLGWSSDLRSATGGRGNSSLMDPMFEKVPGELQQKVIKAIRQRKGLTDAMVGA